MICHHCQREVPVEGQVGIRDTCPFCGEALHSCVNCAFWNRPARRCREPAAEWVSDREKGNYCEYFRPATPPRGAVKDSKEAREAFERLFRRS